jgi:hypothetical protein
MIFDRSLKKPFFLPNSTPVQYEYMRCAVLIVFGQKLVYLQNQTSKFCIQNIMHEDI